MAVVLVRSELPSNGPGNAAANKGKKTATEIGLGVEEEIDRSLVPVSQSE